MSTNGVPVALESEYGRFFQAFQAKDLETLLSFFTDDFAWELLDGSVLDRSQARSALQQQFAEMEVVEAGGEIRQLEVRDEEATVLIRETVVGTMQTLEGPRETLVIREDYRDTWVQQAGSWKMRRGVALSSETVPLNDPARC